MSPSPEAIATAAVMFMALAAYALFAGADLGGGTWDLLAGGASRGAAPRQLIDESITPVWEANHVWLIFVLVLLWTGFPPAFAAIMTALFVPLSASLLGIFLRGVGFAFRHTAERLRVRQFTGAMFAASSLITPFFLGTVIGAVATGQVPARPAGSVTSAWTNLTALLTGGLFVATCGYISAVFLVLEARRRERQDLVRYFLLRATAAALISGALAGITFYELSRSQPHVFAGLTGRALPLVAISIAAGTAVLGMIWLRWYRGLRAAAAIAVVSVVWGWGVAQYPYLLPRSLSLAAGSAPSSSQLAELIIAGGAALIVGPAFVLLYSLQQRGILAQTETAAGTGAATASVAPPITRVRRAAPSPPVSKRAVRLVLAVLVIKAVRKLLSRRPGA